MTGFNSKRDAAADKLQEPEHEALKLALEALKSMKETLAEHDEPTTFNEDEAIASIEAALAQLPLPVQEPVIFYRCKGCAHAYEGMPPSSCDCMDKSGFERIEYYTAPPAQEPDALTIAYQSGYYDGKKDALATREWNFCERCGKRTKDMFTIHTCTPPQEAA